MVLIIASTRGNGLHTPYQINQRYTYFNLHANSMTYAESLKCKKTVKFTSVKELESNLSFNCYL